MGPAASSEWPDDWSAGEYRARLFLFGIIPLGWQAIVISFPPPRGATSFVRDNGYSPLITRWDHWIAISPLAENPGKTHYCDSVTIEAGILTPLVAAFARIFYTNRQKRWRALAASRFAALD